MRTNRPTEPSLPDSRLSLVQRAWNTAVDYTWLLETLAERLFLWAVRHRDLHQYKENQE